MSFTVEDFPGLLRLLEEHPEWRGELRRQLLTEELLGLPDLVRQLAERMDALTQGIDTLVQAQTKTDSRLGALEGEALELRYARRAGAYFSPLALRLRLLDHGRLADLLDEAAERGLLAYGEREDVLLADLVLEGRRRSDQAEVYLLAEISLGIGLDDVKRAADRSTLLARLGRPVVPIVAGKWIEAEAEAMARSYGVSPVLDGRSR